MARERARVLRAVLQLLAIGMVLAVPPTAHGYFAGGGKDARKGNDCLIGYDGITAVDLTPGSKRQLIECTDCDPSCDFDGVSAVNNTCTFVIGVCLNQEIKGEQPCEPPGTGLSNATASYKVKGKEGEKGEFLFAPEDLASTACGPSGASRQIAVALPQRKNGDFRPNTARFKLSASVAKDPAAGTLGRVDKDTLTYLCKPRPAGAACASATTTTLTSPSTTSTTIICVETAGTFCDPGDGTVYDSATGLQWEKKTTAFGSGVNAVDLHDVDNTYAWAGQCSVTTSKYCQPNAAAETLCKAQTPSVSWTSGCERCTGGEGTCDVDPYSLGAITTVWSWLEQVRSANYAGHNDWRLPSEDGRNSGAATDSRELETILLSPPPCGMNPCISSIFGPTASSIVSPFYWSSSTYADFKTRAWWVDFRSGGPGSDFKAVNYYVRAVR